MIGFNEIVVYVVIDGWRRQSLHNYSALLQLNPYPVSSDSFANIERRASAAKWVEY